MDLYAFYVEAPPLIGFCGYAYLALVDLKGIGTNPPRISIF